MVNLHVWYNNPFWCFFSLRNAMPATRDKQVEHLSSFKICGCLWKISEAIFNVSSTPWKINGWNLQPSHLERNMIMIWKQASMREDMFRPFIFEGLVFRMSTKRPVKSVIFFPNPPRRVPQCVLHMRSWTACERPTRGFLSPTLWTPKQPIGEMGEFSPFKMKETLGFFKWHVYMVLTCI